MTRGGGVLGLPRSGAAVCVLLASCTGSIAMATPPFKLTSSVILPNQPIPERYTCDGADASPPLRWSNPPEGTKSFALIVDDPDAPSGTFTHWLLWGLPAEATSLDENAVPSQAKEGTNHFGRKGWGGPCPPPGKPHHYHFRLLALDTAPSLPAGASRADLDRGIKDHVLGQAELVAVYARKSHKLH